MNLLKTLKVISAVTLLSASLSSWATPMKTMGSPGKPGVSSNWYAVGGTHHDKTHVLTNGPGYYLGKPVKQPFWVDDLSKQGFKQSKNESGPESDNQDDKKPTANVPEPGTLSLLGLGLIGLILARRRYI